MRDKKRDKRRDERTGGGALSGGMKKKVVYCKRKDI